MSIHRFEPHEPHPSDAAPTDERVDEREWQLQERALLEERSGAAPGDDPALADYRQVVRALRAPMAPMLPADFATRVAARAQERAQAGARVEHVLTQALLAVLGIAGGVVVVQSGGAWWHEVTARLPQQDVGLGMQWGLAIAACLGLSWAMERLRDHLPR